MEWFDGGVLNAITKCREEKALLIVYVYDVSEASKVTTEAWNNEEVMQILKSHNNVALKVPKDSLVYNQFSQLFAVFVFPSVHCIDLTGKPLVIMHGQQSVQVLKDKLSEAFLKLNELVDPMRSAASNTHESEDKLATPSPTSVQSTEPSASALSPQAETKDEKLKRHEKKIEERKIERLNEDRLKKEQQEKDSRELGKDIANLKQRQLEQQNKSWIKERKKEKEAVELARREVRAKIEQDRRERQDVKYTRTTSLHSQSQEFSGLSNRAPSNSNNLSRVQLRLPLGSTKIVELESRDTLSVLKQKISELLDEKIMNFSLVSVYPRRELTSDNDFKSMRELDLAPTGVIIVRMNRKSVSTNNILWSTLMNLFNYIVWIFNIIKNFAMGLFSSNSGSNPSSIQQNRKIINDNRVKKFHQESYQDDSSDDATYNGNSTQQQ